MTAILPDRPEWARLAGVRTRDDEACRLREAAAGARRLGQHDTARDLDAAAARLAS